MLFDSVEKREQKMNDTHTKHIQSYILQCPLLLLVAIVHLLWTKLVMLLNPELKTVKMQMFGVTLSLLSLLVTAFRQNMQIKDAFRLGKYSSRNKRPIFVKLP